MSKRMFYNTPYKEGYYNRRNKKYNRIGMNYYKRKSMDDLKRVVGLSLLLMIAFGLMFYTCRKGIDEHIENQDKMLCESALISGNREYLKKCECYYETKDIKCLSH